MENASKALLIAAAVLIVILLVAFGMKIFNSTSETKDSANTTGKAISAAVFNAKFEMYAGKSKSADKVLELLNVIKENNEENTERKVNVAMVHTDDPSSVRKDAQGSLNNIIRVISRGKDYPNYKIMHIYPYYNEEGYIFLINLCTGSKIYSEDYDKVKY